jgi:hypothetical protein
MKFIAIAAALVATAAHAQSSDPYGDALDSRDRLCRASYEEPALDPLRSKLPALSGGTLTLELLADQTKPSAEQRAALLAYDRLIADCEAGFKTILTAYRPPQFGAAYRQYTEESQALRAKLYGGGMTFGEYLSAGRSAHSRFAERMDQLDAQFAAQQEAAAASDAQLEAAGAPRLAAPYLILCVATAPPGAGQMGSAA